MATDRGLKSIRNLILGCYADNIIDDEEFVLLYEANKSREIFPFWKFGKFDLDDWDDVQCQSELRFKKGDIYRLKDVLQIPEKVVCSQRTAKICSGIEATCILLKKKCISLSLY